VYPLVLQSNTVAAKQFAEVLATLGVGTRPFFYPIHQQPALLKRGLFADTRLPNAERLAQQGLYLPSGMGLTKEQQDAVIERVLTALQKVYREL
jgi:perosamine synthetase